MKYLTGYLRALAAIVYAAVFLIAGIPLMLVVRILGKKSDEARERFVYRWVYWGLSCEYHICGAKVTVIGREHMPGEAALYISNHRSIFDLIILLPVLGIRMAPVAKKELARVPLLSWWMRQIHCIFLDRESIKAGAAMVTEATEDLKKGLSVLIYPEGTRNHQEGTLLPFHGGSFKIAIRAGAPVVPVTCIGTGDIWEDHKPWVRERKITIVIGEPIPTQGMPIAERKVLHEKCQAIVKETYRRYASTTQQRG